MLPRLASKVTSGLATARSHTVAQHLTIDSWSAPTQPLNTHLQRHTRNAISKCYTFLIKAERSNSLPLLILQPQLFRHPSGSWIKLLVTSHHEPKIHPPPSPCLDFPQKPKGISLIGAKSPTAINSARLCCQDSCGCNSTKLQRHSR